MDFYRQTITKVPPTIEVPKELRNRDVEVIILPLDTPSNDVAEPLDENGYPIGFFERTAGSIPDFPEREPQPSYEIREEIV